MRLLKIIALIQIVTVEIAGQPVPACSRYIEPPHKVLYTCDVLVVTVVGETLCYTT